MTVEEKLEFLRSDTAWAHELDSLAGIFIGPGAKCIDPVKHTFSWDGRLWVFNQDWGGVLEIPVGYVPDDDRLQADISYHGAVVFSPDSLVYISHYEGYQAFGYEEFRQQCVEKFESDSLMVKVDMHEDSIVYKSGTVSPTIAFETLNADGIKGYFKYIHTSPESTEYAVSLQYPLDLEEKYSYILEMIDTYPFGPLGREPRQP